MGGCDRFNLLQNLKSATLPVAAIRSWKSEDLSNNLHCLEEVTCVAPKQLGSLYKVMQNLNTINTKIIFIELKKLTYAVKRARNEEEHVLIESIPDIFLNIVVETHCQEWK